MPPLPLSTPSRLRTLVGKKGKADESSATLVARGSFGWEEFSFPGSDAGGERAAANDHA